MIPAACSRSATSARVSPWLTTTSVDVDPVDGAGVPAPPGALARPGVAIGACDGPASPATHRPMSNAPRAKQARPATTMSNRGPDAPDRLRGAVYRILSRYA